MAIEPVRLHDRRAELKEVLGSAKSYYQGQLLHDRVGAKAQAFLKQRGFTEETANCWELGYAPPTWNALTDALRREGFSEEVMLGAGVVRRAHTGRLYDLMWGRVICPVFDQNGSPRGFAGRIVTGDGPKYLNGPETVLNTKRSLLYGLHLAKPAIAKADQAVIVEGYTDAIAAH
jgi:DNA primase